VSDFIDLLLEQKTVDSKTNDVEELIKAVEQKTEVAVKSNEEASLKQAMVEDQAKKIIHEKEKADSSLMEALPAVEAAAEALNNIRREDLQELKSFNNPPIHVKIVCQMCAVFRPTGEKLDDSWGDSKKMLGNPRLLDLLKAYPKDSITEKMYRSCKKMLSDNERHEITVENLATVSQAGKGLVVWVLAILRYYEVAKNVEPLREMVKKMEKAQARTESELAQVRTLLDKLNEELRELNKGYRNANNDLTELQSQAMIMEKRLTAASNLMDGLTAERSRWSNDSSALGRKCDTLVGDSLLAASFLSYSGPFNAEYRRDLIQGFFGSSGLAHSKDFQVQNILTTDVILQHWNAKGLPSDKHSIQNGILTTMGIRFPLCIDPQQQAVTWIKNTFAAEQLTVKTLKDSDFMKHLELAIRFGKPFLFENVLEEIDPILDPVLEKAVFTGNGSTFICLGDKMMEWDNNFRLFFCTKLSNPSYTPEITGKVTMINYCVTKEGLTDQLLNIVVKHERPELEEQFRILVDEMAQNAKLLRQFEDSLLHELSSSSGNILDNDELISTLDKTKANAIDIQNKIASSRMAKEKIHEARNAYQSVAKRGSLLYFASSGLSSINSIYEVSLELFLKQFIRALDSTHPEMSLDQRLHYLVESCTRKIYDFTCMGIFEQHKLTFSFYLTCMVLEDSGKLESTALSFFLEGRLRCWCTSR